MRRSLLALAALGASIFAAAAAAPAQTPSGGAAQAPAADTAEHWKGTVTLPMHQKLEFIVNLTRGQPGSGTISIPLQGLKDGELSDVSVTDTHLEFTLKVPTAPARFVADVDAANTRTARGTLQQHGQEFPLALERTDSAELKRTPRPQEPTPPFPYTQREVTYTNSADGATFAATLTIPQGAGPHPAVLLITGSGPEDRDETIFDHKPFLIIADHLTRRGIAVLRADDRGVGGSTNPHPGQDTTETYVGDALAGVEFLKHQPEIDPARIGLVGHSEGGEIAPMAAARSSDVAFIVLLAGPGVPGDQVLTEQLAAAGRAAGMDEAMIARQRAVQERVLQLSREHARADQLKPAIRELALLQMEAAGDTKQNDAVLDRIAEQQAAVLTSPWLQAFMALDPREALRKVHCPVLALNGSLDVQVVAKQNLPEIEKALKEAGNPDATTRILPGLNHLFQTARTGGVQEYAEIQETVAPAALEAMSDWIVAHTRAKKSER